MPIDIATLPHGIDTRIFLMAFDASGYSNSVTASGAIDEHEVKVFSPHKIWKLGKRKTTLKVETVYDTEATPAGLRAQLDIWRAGAALQNVIYCPASLTVGRVTWFGVGNLLTTSLKAPSNDVLSASIDIGFSGKACCRGHILAGGQVSATGTGTTVDAGAPRIGAAGGAVQICAYAHTGTGETLDVVVQHSVNGTDWTTLATFTQIADAVGSERKTFTGAVNRYRRVLYTVNGTLPTWDFVVVCSEF